MKAVTVIFAFLCLAPAEGAPAPAYREPPPRGLVGRWAMDWQGVEWEAGLGRDGRWWRRRVGSPPWYGVWRIEGSVLCVEEWPEGGAETNSEHAIHMRQDLQSGVFAGGGRFALRKPRQFGSGKP